MEHSLWIGGKGELDWIYSEATRGRGRRGGRRKGGIVQHIRAEQAE
jgi:hypothetical protein